MAPHTLAGAWNAESLGRGVSEVTPGYDDAQNLFYAGAAAMLAMIAQAGPDRVMLVAFMQTMQAELKEYLDSLAP
ncbi:MAG TPA: hypothetical protein VFB50_00215 [Chloroflexota bacterium]|nr:hypothetical protein [Chloroflexota bacterium]